MAKRTYIYICLCAVLAITSVLDCHAQRYPERKFIREGNKDYEKGEWIDSEVDYRRALEKDPDSYEAIFNLGNSLYKQERYEEAEQIFQKLGQDTIRPDHSSENYFNSGNSQFKQRKLQEALESYKEALRKNPADTEAKFNLAYVKKLLEDQDDDQDDDENDDQNDDQNDDNQDNQDQNNNDDQDNQNDNDQNDDQNNDQNNNDGDGNNDNNQDQNNQPPPSGQDQPQPSGMTREDAERMLDAIQKNEDQTREKMDEEKGKAIIKSDKNW